MDFGVLGPVEVRFDGQLVPVGRARERFVLATLLINAGRLVTADALIHAIWPEPPSSAKAQLHNLISALRRKLHVGEGEVVRSRPAGYELSLGQHTLDLLEFRRLVQSAGEGDDVHAVAMFDQALALWRGPALADVDDEFAAAIRGALHEEKFAAQQARLESLLALGRYEDVLRAVPPLLDEHPYQESLHRMQMQALAATGRRADALSWYRRTYRRFVDDLGVEPGQDLAELEQRILRDRIPVAEVLPRQLPLPVASLTGRDKLLTEIVGALRSGPARVALLTGPGGVGKTALALAVAQHVGSDFPDGQLYADLRAEPDRRTEPHAVAGRFLRALGVDGASVPEDPDERISLYRSLLAERRMLVVLDNAASESQVRSLVPGSAQCRTLIATRQRFDALVGAARWTVPVLTTSDAIELLADAVGRDRVSHEPAAAAEVVELCAHLPLALTIAAARLTGNPQWTMAEFRDRLAGERSRLDELSAGDLDVRASISLSYAGLSDEARALMRRLGLLTAAEWPAWVAGDGAGRLLDRLIESHLVEPVGRDTLGQARFRLHDLVADFARERAFTEDSPEQRVRTLSTMLSGWLALAATADDQIPHGVIRPEPAVEGLPAPSAAVDLARDQPAEWFEAERRSLADAVEQASRHGLADLAGRIALRLSGFLWLRAYDEEWDQALRSATMAVRAAGLDHLLVRLLDAQFEVGMQLHRYAELPAIAAEERAAAARIGDYEMEVSALRHSGRAALRLDRAHEAVAAMEKAVSIARRPGMSEALLSDCLTSLGWAHRESGDPELALPLLTAALDIDRRVGESFRTGLRLYHFGIASTDAGNLADAEQALGKAMTIAEAAGDDSGMAYVEQALADVDIRRNRLAQAGERLSHSLRGHEGRGDDDGIATSLRSLGHLAAIEQRWQDAVELLRQSLAIWHRIGPHVEVERTRALLDKIQNY